MTTIPVLWRYVGWGLCSAIACDEPHGTSPLSRPTLLLSCSPLFSPPLPSPPLPQSHMDWEVVDVLLWLKAVNLEPYCALFRQHQVNGKKLDRMNRASLEEMGVSDPFHMDNIMECIDELCRKKSTRQSSVVCVCVHGCEDVCVGGWV